MRMAHLERIKNICFKSKSNEKQAITSSRKNKGLQEKICNHGSATCLQRTVSPNYSNANRDGNYTWSCNLLGDLDSDPVFPSQFYQQ